MIAYTRIAYAPACRQAVARAVWSDVALVRVYTARLLRRRSRQT